MSQKVLEIIETSGGDLPYEVAAIFEQHGWNVQIGPHYIDVASGKTREIDLIVKKEIEVYNQIFEKRQKFTIRLFVECKNLISECVVYFTAKNKENAFNIIEDDSIFRGNEQMVQEHHYIKDEQVAKTWNMKGRDDFYDAWTQSVHSAIYFSNNSSEPYSTINMPIVVLKSFDNLYKREPGNAKFSKITTNFQLEIDYSYPYKEHSLTKTFLVDFTSLETLPVFLGSVSKDISIAERIVMNQLSERGFQEQRNYRDTDNRPVPF